MRLGCPRRCHGDGVYPQEKTAGHPTHLHETLRSHEGPAESETPTTLVPAAPAPRDCEEYPEAEWKGSLEEVVLMQEPT